MDKVIAADVDTDVTGLAPTQFKEQQVSWHQLTPGHRAALAPLIDGRPRDVDTGAGMRELYESTAIEAFRRSTAESIRCSDLRRRDLYDA